MDEKRAQRLRNVNHWIANRPWLFGVFLLLVLHRRLLSRRWSIPWDASGFLLPLQHWFASAVTAGEDPSWCPLLGGGFPAAREIQFGYMGLLYPLTALMFRGTTVATSMVLLILYLVTFFSTFGMARMLGIGKWPAAWAGVWITASGWWLGNASHLPYLTSASFTLLIAAGLFGFAQGRRWAPLAVIAGWILAVNGCYPTTLLFGGQIIVILAFVMLCFGVLAWKDGFRFLLASALGIGATLPTLFSAATWFRQTWRAGGLTVDQTLARSTAPEALKTFFMPLIPWPECKWPGAVDVTLDRFHLTFAAIPLLLIAIVHFRRWSRWGWLCAILVLIGTDACLGKYAWLRAFLARHFWFERLNRCLPADHGWLIPAALSIGLAAVLDQLWCRYIVGQPARTIFLNLVLTTDVVIVVLGISRGLVIGRSQAPWRPPPAQPYKIVWTPSDQSKLDAGRACDEEEMKCLDNTPSIPDRMLPWGFLSAGVNAYEEDFFARRLEWICGPGKLRDALSAAPVAYRLIRYAPTEVRILVPSKAPRDLVWNDVNDSWWTITVEGQDVHTAGAPSGMRRFALPPGEVEVVMAYEPRIPIWNGWLAATVGLLLGGTWTWCRRRRYQLICT